MTSSTTADALPPANPEPVYRRNFIFFLLDNIFFNIAFNTIGRNTVIPDFLRRLTSSEMLIGFASMIFEVGWLLPQLFVARFMVRLKSTKLWFILPNIPVRFMILLFGVLMILIGKDRPQTILIAFLACYSIAALGDGLVSVPWGVLAGKSLDNRWRARTFGINTVVTGLSMLGIAPLIGLVLGSPRLAFPNNYAVLFIAAGGFFVLSILPIVFVRELPGGKVADKTPSLAEFLPSLGRVLRTDTAFRAMIIVRGLTSLFEMASPFYIGFATVKLGLSSTVAVPTLLSMQTIGGIGGALIFTWLGARSNLMFIRLALGAAAFWPLSALLAGSLGPVPLYIGFMISGLTVSNMFMGFYNWVIGYSTTEQRPVYIGLFNTISAVVTLFSPLIGGAIVQGLGYQAVFAVALVMVVLALVIMLKYIHR